MIVRPDYVQAIAPFMDQPLVKILSGVRRCGKSTILAMIREELRGRGVPEARILSRNYASTRYDGFTAAAMYAELKAALVPGERCYLFLDEVQEVDGWERVVNTLLEEEDTDLYVTGSNSRLMAGELATYLTGRYVSIPVYPLSFREYLTFRGLPETEARAAFPRYLRQGGFPLIARSDFDDRSADQIAEGIYAAVVTRDIAVRHGIRDRELFDRVMRYVTENVGKTFSANAIVQFLKAEKRTLTVENIYNDLKWLAEAFVIYPCLRYDLQGKAVLKTQEKYYLSDPALKYCILGFDGRMIAAMLENLVFLELRRRGYSVWIGKDSVREIDFVGERRGERVYIQVCRQLPEDSDRETGNLKALRDHYPKYVVTMDELAGGNDNGVRIVHIADFLLMPAW